MESEVKSIQPSGQADDPGGTLRQELDRARRVQTALFDISRATSESDNLADLLAAVHRSVGSLVDATNFYVALYDAELGLYSFPYWVDARDSSFEPQPLTGSFTDHVRRTGQPLLADGENYLRLVADGVITPVGPDSAAWLGAPLRTAEGIIGVVAVQSYLHEELYSQSDLELITFAAEQIAWAIERKQFESALRESERFVRGAFDGLLAHIAVIDENGVILGVNEAWRAFARENGGDPDATCEDANYFGVCEGTDDPLAAAVAQGVRAVLAGQKTRFEQEYPCHSPQERRWFNLRAARLPGDGPARAVIAHESITRRKQVEDALYFISGRGLGPDEADSFFDALVSYLAESLSADYAFVGELHPDRSETIRTVAFHDRGEPGKNFEYTLPGSPCETVVGHQLCSYQSGVQQMFPQDRGLVRLDVDSYVGMPLTDSGGGPLGLIAVMNRSPIGNLPLVESILSVVAERASHELERSRSEQALRESEDRYQTLFTTMMDGFALHRILLDDAGQPVDYRFLDVNPAWERYTGLTREQVIGRTVREVMPGTEDHWIETYGRVALGGGTIRFENRAADINNHWFDVLAFQTEPEHFAVIFHDVTDRRRANDALRDSERRFRAIVEGQTEFIVRWQVEDGSLTFVNEAYARYLDRPSSDLIGTSVQSFMSGDEWRDLQSRLTRLTPGSATQMDTYRRDMPDGRSVWQEWTDHGLFDEDGNLVGVQSVGRDVTERKLIADALQEHALRLASLREIDQAILAGESPLKVAEAAMTHIRLLIPSVRSSVILFGDDPGEGTILAVTGQDTPLSQGVTIQMSGPIIERLRQRRIVEVRDLELVEDPTPAQRALLATGVKSYVSAPLMVQDRLFGALNAGVAEPDGFAPEYRQIVQEVADQIAIAIHQQRLQEQVRAHTDELEQRVAERTAELKEANEQLRALTRLKDEFVSNVSHELRTPITSLKLNHTMLALNPERSEVYLARLERETERLNRLIEDLLRLSRLDQGRTELEADRLDLNGLVMEYAADRAPLAREQGMHLSLTQAPALAPVRADAGLLGQVLSILLTNALTYTPPGGSIELRTLSRRADGSQWSGFCVTDTGPGLSAMDLPQVFDRFYRGSAAEATNSAGTGLGLAIAREIVERHAGTIEAANRAEGGAVFTVWLPAADKTT